MEAILSSKWLSTRNGALTIGAVAAVLAAVVLVVYLREYRESVRSGSEPLTVLVAKNLIPKGTAGTLVGSKGLFQTTSIPKNQAKEGALADPAVLDGRVALRDIFPGQQLTAADFSAATTDALATKLTGAQRALALPVDSTHAVAGQVAAGDRVDIYVGFSAQQGSVAVPTLKLLAENVLVLSAPTAEDGRGASAQGGNVIIRLGAERVAEFAFAADNGQLWLVLRPQVGARPTPPDMVTVRSLLAGSTPIGG